MWHPGKNLSFRGATRRGICFSPCRWPPRVSCATPAPNRTVLETKTGAMMKSDLLRFNGAVERDPAIDAWMKDHACEFGAIASRARRRCNPPRSVRYAAYRSWAYDPQLYFLLELFWQEFFSYESQAFSVDHHIVVEATTRFTRTGIYLHQAAVGMKLHSPYRVARRGFSPSHKGVRPNRGRRRPDHLWNRR